MNMGNQNTVYLDNKFIYRKIDLNEYKKDNDWYVRYEQIETETFKQEFKLLNGKVISYFEGLVEKKTEDGKEIDMIKEGLEYGEPGNDMIALYKGSYQNNKRNGKGMYRASRGTMNICYDGDWKDGIIEGVGMFQQNEYKDNNENILKYNGEFKDGKFHGNGQISKKETDNANNPICSFGKGRFENNNLVEPEDVKITPDFNTVEFLDFDTLERE